MRGRDLVAIGSGLSLLACIGGGRPEPEGAGVDDCWDGADNDEDGGFDCDDDGCLGSPDCEEEPEEKYAGGWPTGACADDVDPSLLPDMTLVDQYGDEVRLYDFCGEAVLIHCDAFWNGAIFGMNDNLLDWHSRYADRGLIVVQAIAENGDSQTPDAEELADWADEYGMDFPVLADAGWALDEVFERDNGIPTVVLLDADLEVVFPDGSGAPTDAEIEAILP